MHDSLWLYIDGTWVAPQGQGLAEVQNPATEQTIGREWGEEGLAEFVEHKAIQL